MNSREGKGPQINDKTASGAGLRQPLKYEQLRAVPTNAALPTRERLAQHELEKLTEVVNRNRHGPPRCAHDLLAYRHGLRAAEVVDLRWADGGAARAEGQERHHPLTAREMRELLLGLAGMAWPETFAEMSLVRLMARS